MRRQPPTRPTTLCLALIVGGWALGCSESPASPGRTPQTPPPPTQGPPPPLPPTPPPPPAPPSNTSNALITIENPYVIVHGGGSPFAYAVRFLLRETGGVSGATIESILVYGPSGSDEASVGCWRDTLRVPANDVLDTFYTDAGANWLSYCGPGSGGNTATPTLYVVVMFRDDNGVFGSVGAAISTLR